MNAYEEREEGRGCYRKWDFPLWDKGADSCKYGMPPGLFRILCKLVFGCPCRKTPELFASLEDLVNPQIIEA